MKDLDIQYRNGKLHRLVVDGVEFDGNALKSLYLKHEVPSQVPNFSITLQATGKRRLISSADKIGMELNEN